MRGWMLNLAAAALIVVLMIVSGVDEGVKVFVLLAAWFVVLGALCLGVEMLTQRIGAVFRRTPSGPSPRPADDGG